MPIRPIRGVDEGLMFDEFFDEPGLVAAALWRLAGPLDPAICYCLRFHCVEGGISWFEPYGNREGWNGFITDPQVTLPSSIPYHRLMARDVHGEWWPALAEWQGNQNTATLPTGFTGAGWHGEVRLEAKSQARSHYVGYFKAVMPSGQGRLEDDDFSMACQKAKEWLREAVAERRKQQVWLDPMFKAAVASAHLAVSQKIRERRPREALRILFTLITSHLGAGLNRVLCLVPSGSDDLECVYAHGGDCSDEFAASVQFPLSQRVRSIGDLHAEISTGALPIDDPLYRDLVTDRVLRFRNLASSQSLLGELWRHDGDIGQLHSDHTIATSDFQLDLPMGTVRVGSGRELAVKLTRADHSLRELLRERPSSPLHKNKNGTYFAVPWRWVGGWIGLLIYDLGYWATCEKGDVLPKLVIADALLAEFSGHFDQVQWW